MEKYILAVLNPNTNEKHFGKPNTLDEVIKESKLFKGITIYTEKEYEKIKKGLL